MANRRVRIVLLAALFIYPACAKEDTREAKPAIELSGEDECALDGMIVANYPGPKAQILYKGDRKPDFFCETKEMFQIYLEPGRKAEISAVYVQDTSEIDWKKPEDSWIDARSAYYVVGSRRMGSMGPTYAPFADRNAALVFVEKYGGKVMNFDDLIKQLGG